MLRRHEVTRALVAVLVLGPVVAMARPKVVVVRSADLAPYAQVTAGFSAEVKADVSDVLLEEGADAAQKTLKKVAEQPPALVLAVGPAAAVNARRQFSDVPIVFAMVPYFQKYDLEGANTTGIALTSDLSLELTAARALLPRVKRIGVVVDPRYSKAFVDEATQLAQSRGLSLVPIEIDNLTKLDKALSGAKGRIDALAVVSDKTVANAAVVERLLAFARDEALPVIGLAPGQVKQGALFALAPAPLSIGLQAGRIANRIVVEKVDPGALAVAPPEGVELHVNLGVARRLGLPEGFAGDVLVFAARQGLAVKAVE
ncbi:MAG: ABC transporter substrate-binding protein [Myxococcaceae bacterium]|nr:ABC transporter substrate-binding protein [Myxococcaceae bacterium]